MANPSIPKKNGRPQQPYKTSQGEYINGLSRRPDSRWRVIGTHQTFREPDEAKAIERFKELIGEGKSQLERSYEFYLKQVGIDWAFVAREIRSRPQWVAQQTGIEWIAYGPTLKPPKPLPTPKEVEKFWRDNSTAAREEVRKVAAAWNDFVKTSKIVGLGDISSENVIAFRREVQKRGIGGKTQQHLFNRIRRIISFARGEGLASEELKPILETLSLLRAKDTSTALDPKPIAVDEFQKLLEHAEGETKAMILLMLNGAFYLEEVVRLKWEDIKDGCIATRREKKGKCLRVCVLWQETIDALAKVERKGDRIFWSYNGLPLTVSGAGKRFRKLRKMAGLPHIVASQLRDGAYTAAVDSSVEERFCKLLVGHRIGISDHYVLRKPSMVKPACDAIHKFYFEKCQPSDESGDSQQLLKPQAMRLPTQMP